MERLELVGDSVTGNLTLQSMEERVPLELELVQERVHEFVAITMGGPRGAHVRDEKQGGIVLQGEGREPMPGVPRYPPAWLEAATGGTGNRDIGGGEPVGFGFLRETEENSTDGRGKVKLPARARRHKVQVHAAYPKELTEAKPTQPKEWVRHPCPRPMKFLRATGARPATRVEMAIEGSDVSVSKGPTGTGIFPNPASKPFDKLPQSGIGIDRGVELEQTLLAIVKDATRGGSKEKGHGVVPTHGTPELSRGVWGHRKAIRGGGRPHRMG